MEGYRIAHNNRDKVYSLTPKFPTTKGVPGDSRWIQRTEVPHQRRWSGPHTPLRSRSHHLLDPLRDTKPQTLRPKESIDDWDR